MNTTNKDLVLADASTKRFTDLLPVTIYLSILIITGVIGNILVIIIYVKRPKKTLASYFILSLASFDLLTSAFAMPFEIIDMMFYYNFHVPWVCKMMRFVTVWTVLASDMSLVVIAFDRYFKVRHPLRRFTVQRTQILICWAVVSGLIFSWPNIFMFGDSHLKLEIGNQTYVTAQCSFDADMAHTRLRLIYFVLLGGIFLLFITIFVILYACILKSVHSQNIAMCELNESCGYNRKISAVTDFNACSNGTGYRQNDNRKISAVTDFNACSNGNASRQNSNRYKRKTSHDIVDVDVRPKNVHRKCSDVPISGGNNKNKTSCCLNCVTDDNSVHPNTGEHRKNRDSVISNRKTSKILNDVVENVDPNGTHDCAITTASDPETLIDCIKYEQRNRKTGRDETYNKICVMSQNTDDEICSVIKSSGENDISHKDSLDDGKFRIVDVIRKRFSDSLEKTKDRKQSSGGLQNLNDRKLSSDRLQNTSDRKQSSGGLQNTSDKKQNDDSLQNTNDRKERCGSLPNTSDRTPCSSSLPKINNRKPSVSTAISHNIAAKPNSDTTNKTTNITLHDCNDRKIRSISLNIAEKTNTDKTNKDENNKISITSTKIGGKSKLSNSNKTHNKKISTQSNGEKINTVKTNRKSSNTSPNITDKTNTNKTNKKVTIKSQIPKRKTTSIDSTATINSQIPKRKTTSIDSTTTTISSNTTKPINIGRMTWIFFTLSCVFCLSHIPVLILYALRTKIQNFEEEIERSSLTIDIVYQIFLRAYFINNSANPIVYSFMSPDFRKESVVLFKGLFRRYFCRRN